MKITKAEAAKRVKESKGARERELCARYLLANQDKLPSYMTDGKWDELAALKAYVERGIPPGTQEHDPAQFNMLTKQFRELKKSGMFDRVLEALIVHKGLAVPFDGDQAIKQFLSDMDPPMLGTAKQMKRALEALRDSAVCIKPEFRKALAIIDPELRRALETAGRALEYAQGLMDLAQSKPNPSKADIGGLLQRYMV